MTYGEVLVASVKNPVRIEVCGIDYFIYRSDVLFAIIYSFENIWRVEINRASHHRVQFDSFSKAFQYVFNIQIADSEALIEALITAIPEHLSNGIVKEK